MKQLFEVSVEITRSGVVVVWAEDAQEAEEIARDDVESSEDSNVWIDSALLTHVRDIPADWADAEPIGGDYGLTCRKLLTTARLEQLMEQLIIDTRQLRLGEKPTATMADETDHVCREYARLLTKLHRDDYTAEELDRCFELSQDPLVQRRLEEARQRDLKIAEEQKDEVPQYPKRRNLLWSSHHQHLSRWFRRGGAGATTTRARRRRRGVPGFRSGDPNPLQRTRVCRLGNAAGKEINMTEQERRELIRRCRNEIMSNEERALQRISFARGNVNLSRYRRGLPDVPDETFEQEALRPDRQISGDD